MSTEERRRREPGISWDGLPVYAGVRVYNYYDALWGVVMDCADDRGWFTVRHDDGWLAVLNAGLVIVNGPSRPQDRE